MGAPPPRYRETSLTPPPSRRPSTASGSGGTIVNPGSLCNRVRDNGVSLYVATKAGATKAGAAGFTDALRKEPAPRVSGWCS